MSTDKKIAAEILRQLGGFKFIAMTGAKGLVALENGMACKLMRGRDKINYVKIILNVMDTYDITFYSVRGINITTVKTVEGIYNDQLQDVISENTGLALTLGEVAR